MGLRHPVQALEDEYSALKEVNWSHTSICIYIFRDMKGLEALEGSCLVPNLYLYLYIQTLGKDLRHLKEVTWSQTCICIYIFRHFERT